MNQVEKYKAALQYLKDLNCPSVILDALEVWGIFVREDDIKRLKWEALPENAVEIAGEFHEV